MARMASICRRRAAGEVSSGTLMAALYRAGDVGSSTFRVGEDASFFLLSGDEFAGPTWSDWKDSTTTW